MTSIVTKTGDYTLLCAVQPIDAIPGLFHMRFESALNTAKDPDAKRQVFNTTVDGHGLNEIGRAIYETLHEGQ